MPRSVVPSGGLYIEVSLHYHNRANLPIFDTLSIYRTDMWKVGYFSSRIVM